MGRLTAVAMDTGISDRTFRNGIRELDGAEALPPETPATIDVQAIPPTLAVRDRLKDAKADEILVRHGAMSVQTMAMRHGLEPEQQ